jgi:hypothetical protein
MPDVQGYGGLGDVQFGCSLFTEPSLTTAEKARS